MQRYVLICYSSKQKLLELPNQDLASFFFNSCTLLTNFKSNSNSNQIFRMTETAYFPDLICLNRILKKSVDITVLSASLLTVASFLKQFFKPCLGREGEREGIFSYGGSVRTAVWWSSFSRLLRVSFIVQKCVQTLKYLWCALVVVVVGVTSLLVQKFSRIANRWYLVL